MLARLLWLHVSQQLVDSLKYKQIIENYKTSFNELTKKKNITKRWVKYHLRPGLFVYSTPNWIRRVRKHCVNDAVADGQEVDTKRMILTE